MILPLHPQVRNSTGHLCPTATVAGFELVCDVSDLPFASASFKNSNFIAKFMNYAYNVYMFSAPTVSKNCFSYVANSNYCLHFFILAGCMNSY